MKMRAWLNNPFGILVMILICSLVFGIVYFVLFVYTPEKIGLMHQPEIVVREAYTFSQLEIKRDYLQVKIRDGVLVSGYGLSDTEATVIIGEGEYNFHVPEPYQEKIGEESISDRFTLAQLMVPSTELPRLLEETTVVASVDSEIVQRARRLSSKPKGLISKSKYLAFFAESPHHQNGSSSAFSEESSVESITMKDPRFGLCLTKAQNT